MPACAWPRCFLALGELDRATRLREAAAELQRRFEDAFWCEDLGFYAFGLDPDKQPIATLASNVGHCLWSGLLRADRAALVVQRLMEPNFSSGWGIRTLPSDHPAYNPYSYHRGSVWPHDNALIALGFKRYGFADECARVARDVFGAASFFAGYRLPELYAGLPRQPGSFPVQYLGANIPQAWAAGSIFQLIQAMLGLRADAPNHRLAVHPTLPTWLPDVPPRRRPGRPHQVDPQVLARSRGQPLRSPRPGRPRDPGRRGSVDAVDVTYDVIVVGAGPAGSASASLFAEQGRRVLLLDAARFPRAKPCAEYVSPGGVAILDRLGALERIEAPARTAGYAACRSARRAGAGT